MFCIYSGDPDGPFNPEYWNSVEEYNTAGKFGARPSFPSHPRAFIAAASTLPADSETNFCAIMYASICRVIAVLLPYYCRVIAVLFAVDLREAHVDRAVDVIWLRRVLNSFFFFFWLYSGGNAGVKIPVTART